MPTLFPRYIWLVNTIYQAGEISFDEINAKWLRHSLSEGKKIPLRTFHNHRAAIEELFDINIDCKRNGGYKYYIENKNDIKNDALKTYLLNAFAVNTLIDESRGLKNRILFEKIPSGQRFLTPIIEAMRDNLRVEITYQNFWRSEPHSFEIEPYSVKVFRQRWYVLAFNPYYEALRIYALDRILDLKMTENRFAMPDDFDAETYFANTFGIIVDENIKPCTVKIKTFGTKTKYFQTLPLHHSQTEIETTADYSIFSYFIAPTFDFRQELLSHGEEIEVISPHFLCKEMGDNIKKMNRLYCRK